MISLNLLPDIKKEFIRAQRTRNMVISGSILVSLIAAGVVFAMGLTVYAGQKLIITSQEKAIVDNHKALANKPEIDKLLTIQSQLGALSSVEGERAMYVRLLDYLQQLSPATYGVRIYGLTIDKPTTSLKLTGGADNFESINNFKNAIENATLSYTYTDPANKNAPGAAQQTPFFTAITNYQAALSNTANKSGTSFSFELTYDPYAFDINSTDTRLTVPKLITSDGDKNAPKEIFSAAPTETKNGN